MLADSPRWAMQCDSDLDVLVEFEHGRSALDLVRLERELVAELGLDVDVMTPAACIRLSASV